MHLLACTGCTLIDFEAWAVVAITVVELRLIRLSCNASACSQGHVHSLYASIVADLVGPDAGRADCLV
jgi:hypothetical protein